MVPVGPGDGAWRALLPCLAGLETDCEVLLVAPTGDASSSEAATLPQARWLQAPAGRASQQNAGAAAARGALVWFLHCDSLPDATALRCAAALPPGFDALGWFGLAFHDGDARHALNAAGANLRARCGLPFGDQGLLLPAQRFRELRGFDPQLPRGEDLDLVVRARAAGLRLQRLPGTVTTSARRYQRHGWAATTLRHLWLTATLLCASRRHLRDASREPVR